MKIGIIGAGLVGSTAAYALILRGLGSEIVLVDKNQSRAQAEADDLLHATPFAHPAVVTAGTHEDLAGCRVILLTAGANQKPGETRLQLLERNAAIFRTIVPQAVAAAPDAVLVVATNPVDVMTHLTASLAAEHGIPSSRVVGSGTMLDTARFRALLAREVGVDPQHVHAYVIGEHGDSEVLAWSLVSVGGIPLDEFAASRNLAIDDTVRKRIDAGVRRAAYSIIEGKGATYFGVGSALGRLVDVIVNDRRALLTVSTRLPDIAGIADVSVSLLHLVGGDGVLASYTLPLTESERAGLADSARIIRDAISSLATSPPA